MPKLDDALYEQILKLSKHADSKLQRGECAQAAAIYQQALAMLPQPMEQWKAATWLSGSAANALFLDRNYRDALTEIRRTLQMPGAVENPFIHLRYGQILYELGYVDRAKQELLIAYATEGTEIFEQDHPKYLELIQEII